MKFTTLLPIIASHLVLKARAGNYPVKLDFAIHRGNSKEDMALENEPQFVKRSEQDDKLTMELTNKATFYVAELKIGSNKDQVGVLVDTGSSDLVVLSEDLKCYRRSNYKKRGEEDKNLISDQDLGTPGSARQNKAGSATAYYTDVEGYESVSGYESLYESKSAYFSAFQGYESYGSYDTLSDYQTSTYDFPTTDTCTSYGSFATENSDSFSVNGSAPEFLISYADGTGASGVWGTDEVEIGNATVNSLSFAVANKSTSNVGILGIGLAGLETTKNITNGEGYEYSNLPLKLKSQGIIEKALYSLYLGNVSDKHGLVLFGAIDNAKYTGNLKTVKMVNSYKNVSDVPLRIEVENLAIKVDDGESISDVSHKSIPVLLDTGATYSHLYHSVLTDIVSKLGGSYSLYSNLYTVPCSSEGSITFEFSGQEIAVPMHDLIKKSTDGTCTLTLLPQSSSRPYMSLGDNFLRHAYVVCDLDNYEVSLAPIKYSTDEDIEVITSLVPTMSPGSDSHASKSDSHATSAHGKSKSAAGVPSFKVPSLFQVVIGLVFMFLY